MSSVLWEQEDSINQANSLNKIAENFLLASDIQSADLCGLPLNWNYYIDHNRVADAANLYQEAVTAPQKPFIVFSAGDFTANIPFPSISIFQSSAYRSRNGNMGQQLYVLPAFIPDYLKLYRDGSFLFREWKEKPAVGFCGQASGNIIDYARRKARILVNKIAYKGGFKKWEPPPFEPSSYRNKILTTIQQNHLVSPNFIMRQKYRAGYTPMGRKDPLHPTRIEFINNILNSDYTVCMRGGGNFSVRFYETLSLGRIPVFFDSDSPLPFEEWINYKELFVYIEEHEIPYAAEKIAEFHHSLTPQKFLDLQVACREVWVKYLSYEAYFRNFSKLIIQKKDPK